MVFPIPEQWKNCMLCGGVGFEDWGLCVECIKRRSEEAERSSKLGHCKLAKDVFEQLRGGPKALTAAEKDRGAGI
jgi:hypothetical protein